MHTMNPTAACPTLVQEVTVARLDCAFDQDTALRVKEQLSSLFCRPGHVVLDLQEARLDSVGLGAILSLQRKLELQGRRLFVVSDAGPFRELLARAGVSDCLTLFEHADEAMTCARASHDLVC